MNFTTPKILGALTVVALAVAGLLAYRAWAPADAAVQPDARQGDSPPPSAGGEDAPRPQSRYYAPPAEVPMAFRDFYAMSQMKRLNAVTAKMEDGDLPPATLAFFKAELFNRNHWDVTRNNMANALVWQDKPDPELHRLFIKMLEDQTEGAVWRDYCLQFLSECLPSSSAPEVIEATLREYSQKAETNMAGTATVHLAYQEGADRVQLGEGFSRQLARQLDSAEVTDATKLSILGVAGKRRDRRLLPLVRAYAEQDANASLKRTAIASLGLIGDTRDEPVIRAGLDHPNRAVQMAAKAALRRLQATE